MRLGIEITPLTPAPTGVGYYVRHLLAALTALPDCPPLIGFASGLHAPHLDGLTIRHRRLPLPTRALYHSWEHLHFPRVDSLLGGLDVYHAVNYVLPALKRAAGVLTIHDLAFLHHPEWCSPKIVGPFRRLVGSHAQRAQAVITCSEATKNDIVALLDVDPGKIHVIYHAADPQFTCLPGDTALEKVKDDLGIEAPYLLFVGTIEPRKNLDGLLRAFAKTDLPHTLIIAGAQGWEDDLLGKSGISQEQARRIKFTGYIRDRALFPALYRGATAFLFPSWYEGFGLPVLEAMACGCPVITSDASSLPEVAGDAALYAAPGDPDAWARKIERVAGDDSLRSELREKGLERAGLFSWEKSARATLACYRSVC